MSAVHCRKVLAELSSGGFTQGRFHCVAQFVACRDQITIGLDRVGIVGIGSIDPPVGIFIPLRINIDGLEF